MTLLLTPQGTLKS